MSETNSCKEIIEIGLGSIGKIKIIKALAEESKLATIYVLHKKTHLKRQDIKNMYATNLSAMPGDLEKQVNVQQMRDLEAHAVRVLR